MDGITETTPWQLFLMGGPLMWPILFCSIISGTVAVERILRFTNISKDHYELRNKVFIAMRGNDVKGAIAICDEHKTPLAKIFKAGLLKFSESRGIVEASMQGAIRQEIPTLEKGVVLLSTIVNLAPLLGVLGTVLGLSHMFHMLQIRAEALNPLTSGDIARGVWQALISTAAGLTIAGVALVVHNTLAQQILQITRDMEAAAVELLDLITMTSYSLAPQNSEDL